ARLPRGPKRSPGRRERDGCRSTAWLAARSLCVLLECVKLLAPERLDLVEPATELGEWLPLEAVHPHACVVLETFLADEPRLAHHAQVPAHRRARHREGVGDLAGPTRPRTEQIDHAPPRGLGERSERAIDVTWHPRWRRGCVA